MVTLLKFGTVGIFNTLITFVCYTILIYFGINYLLANFIGYILGILNSYYWNKTWVFKADNNKSKVFFKFLTVNIITLGFNSLILYIFVELFKTNLILGNILAIGFGMLVNFSLNKFWTFK